MGKLWIIAVVLLVCQFNASRSYAAESGDSVFIDEGDNDFESVPTATASGAKRAAAAADKPAPEDDLKIAPQKNAEMPPPSDLSLDDKKPGKDGLVNSEINSELESANEASPDKAAEPVSKAEKENQAASASDATKTPPPMAQEEPVGENSAVKTAHKESHKSHAKVAHKAKSKKADGMFVVTQGPCKMSREPASDSEAIITVKASRKIWVENVDDSWVKGFNKAGTPGYISRDCVK